MPDGPLGVRHKSFAPQPLDLLLRFYVYLLDFGLCCNLIHRLALYQVSVRRLKSFATPLPPLLTLLSAACGSLHLAVTTRDRTFTCKICVMPDTQQKYGVKTPYNQYISFFLSLFINFSTASAGFKPLNKIP